VNFRDPKWQEAVDAQTLADLGKDLDMLARNAAAGQTEDVKTTRESVVALVAHALKANRIRRAS
jgi:hypothetical protein